jgi:hypothetical protein
MPSSVIETLRAFGPGRTPPSGSVVAPPADEMASSAANAVAAYRYAFNVHPLRRRFAQERRCGETSRR